MRGAMGCIEANDMPIGVCYWQGGDIAEREVPCLIDAVGIAVEKECFLSSRRRHTRYWRDWSSDVCSSDLLGTIIVALAQRRLSARHQSVRDGLPVPMLPAYGQALVGQPDGLLEIAEMPRQEPETTDRKSVV